MTKNLLFSAHFWLFSSFFWPFLAVFGRFWLFFAIFCLVFAQFLSIFPDPYMPHTALSALYMPHTEKCAFLPHFSDIFHFCKKNSNFFDNLKKKSEIFKTVDYFFWKYFSTLSGGSVGTHHDPKSLHMKAVPEKSTAFRDSHILTCSSETVHNRASVLALHQPCPPGHIKLPLIRSKWATGEHSRVCGLAKK